MHIRLNAHSEGNIYYSLNSVGQIDGYRLSTIDFEGDVIDDPTALPLKISVNYKQTDGKKTRSRDSVVFANPGELIIDLNQIKDNVKPKNNNSLESYISKMIDVSDLMVGNVFKWSIEVESFLETIGNDIQLKTLLRNQKIASPAELPNGNKFKKLAENCTNPSRDYQILNFPNSVTKKVAVDLHFCIDSKGIIVYASINDTSVPQILSYPMSNNMTSTNQNFVRISYENYLLEVEALRRPMGRKVYTDFFFVEFNLTTLSEQSMKLTKLTRKFL